MEYRINTNTGHIFSKEEYFVKDNWPYGEYNPEVWETMVPIETNEEERWDLQEKMRFIYRVESESLVDKFKLYQIKYNIAMNHVMSKKEI